MKNIAIDKANFEDLILSSSIYVDKTEALYRIITEGKYFFLSRPRRFGKSMTVNTLTAIFEGKKELFNDLYLGSTNWKWESYPIIKLDFNRIPHKTAEILSETIKEILLEKAKIEEIEITKGITEKIFYELVEKLSKKYNKGVVFLVDEYDKPIISHIGMGEEELDVAKENRTFMKNFYDNLKPLEPYLKMVFMTGVSKFSKVSIFSTLNNLIELSEEPEFTDMVGYREDELYKYFDEHFQVFADKNKRTKEDVYANFKFMYNGFRFTSSEIKVYNPFSIGRALYRKEIDNYWFESGTPTFLMNLIKDNNYNVMELEGKRIGKEEVKSYDIEKLELIPLLFQTGYLTIKELLGNEGYVLSYPNNEVESSFNKHLLGLFSNNKIESILAYDIKRAFVKENYDEYFELMNSVFASIPYTIIPNQLEQRELYYHTIFYLATTLMSDNNYKIETEIITSKGRIDMAVETMSKVFIIEFKCNQSAEIALKQIRDKKYADRYKKNGKEICLLGINFSTENKSVEEWKMENWRNICLD